MSYGAFLRDLLCPLGIYRMESGDLSYSETEALGKALDDVEARLLHAEQEGFLSTAEEEGLRLWSALFARPPASPDTESLRAALRALLLIDDASFTLGAINNTIAGCGVSCLVEETETYGTVRVSFPDTMGIPADFERMQWIIEEIIPCHLSIQYLFRFMSWAFCEGKGYTWQAIEAANHTWETFARALD